ncbi:MAG: PLP-dependent aminotransferase family protein [Deltaproteobacteria bacterium]|nr:PLP-dependent aminotransferase family protein [Deltaproteobacteria bacterium]
MGEISFLRGVPAEDALEAVAGMVENHYVKAMREYGAKLLQYQIPGLSDFNGFIPLKKSLADRYGIGGDPNRRVICFNGGMEGLSIVLKAFPRGSQIAMEAMTYDRTLADVLRYEHEVLGIPLTKEGVDLDALEKTLSSGRVKLFYRIIYHQNPTGLDSTMENIEAAAKICARHNTLYLCDIAYYELRYDGRKNRLPDMTAYPDLCLVGSFTKTISAGTKCGFGIFPEALVDRLAPVIANTRLNPNYPTQAMIHKMIESGEYDEYLGYLSRLYQPRMDTLNRSLLKYLAGIEVPQVTGGFFMGIWLPGISDEEGFVKAAKARGVNIAVANVYCPGWKKILQEKHKGSFFRLTFPSLKSEDIEQGIERIATTYKNAKP